MWGGEGGGGGSNPWEDQDPFRLVFGVDKSLLPRALLGFIGLFRVDWLLELILLGAFSRAYKASELV